MQKSLKIKAFDYPFYYKVSRLLRAKQHTPRDAFVDSKGSGNLLRIICILPTSLHIRHGASVEINPPAALSLIHSPTLDRV